MSFYNVLDTISPFFKTKKSPKRRCEGFREMFGMGFAEIILVAVVAIIFLGPDKLPQAMVDIAKFFRAFKKTIAEAKDSLDREISISEIKQEALSYKKSLEEGAQKLSKEIKLDDLEPVLDSELKNKVEKGERVSAEDRERLQKKLQELKEKEEAHKDSPSPELDFKSVRQTPKES